ncbi:MAG: tetratricopeptide repeat protein, partial [Candidatus Wallbacteria bacterium]|nr:tetratricopeptide repeat protein [Candidatus Wallbacteria bacterium]
AYDESIAEFGTVAGDQSILYPYRISALEQIAVCGIRTARIYRYVTPDAKKHADYCNDAIKALQQIIDNWPDQVYRCLTAKFRIGEAYWELGAYTESIAVLDEVLNNAQASSYHKGWSNYFKGMCHYDMGDYAAADTCFAEVEQIWGSAYQAGYARGRCYYQLEKYEDAINALQKVTTVNVYPIDDLMQAEAFLFLGLSREKQEQYPEAFLEFTRLILRSEDKKRFAGFVSSAEKGIKRVLKLEIDRQVRLDYDNDQAVIDLSVRPVYRDGNPFEILDQTRTYVWRALEDGGVSVLPSDATAKVTCDIATFSGLAMEAKLKFNLAAWTGRYDHFVEITSAEAVGYLENIEVVDKDYFIYDVAGYQEGKNILYPCPPSQTEEYSPKKGEPLAYKVNGQCRVRFNFRPNPEYTTCNVSYEVKKGNRLVKRGDGDVTLNPVSSVTHVQEISTPDKIGLHTLSLKLTYSGTPDKRLRMIQAETQHEFFILYENPKYPSGDSPWDLRYNLKKEQFVKKNIRCSCIWAEEAGLSAFEIADKVHQKLVKIPFDEVSINWYPLLRDSFPWSLVSDDAGTFKKMTCLVSACLMTQALNVLGVEDTHVRFMGAQVDGNGYRQPEITSEIKIANSSLPELIGTTRTCQIWITLNREGDESRPFNWDAVCCVEGKGADGKDTDRCYNIALNDETIKGSYKDLINPAVIRKALIRRYVWVWNGPGYSDFYEVQPEDASKRNAFVYWYETCYAPARPRQ